MHGVLAWILYGPGYMKCKMTGGHDFSTWNTTPGEWGYGEPARACKKCHMWRQLDGFEK